MQIRRFDEMPTSRPSRYCLGLQNDSVFADFNVDAEGRIYLQRISFDGWGCYGTADESTRMSSDRSKRFIQLAELNKVETEEFEALFTEYLIANIGVIRKEPLIQHRLIPNV